METIVSMFSGYIFWFVVSKITTPEIVGSSSSIVAFATILSAIVTIGIPTGIQRFLGKNFAENEIGEAKSFVKVSLILVSLGAVISSIALFLLRGILEAFLNTDLNLLLISMILVTSSGFSALFRSVVLSSLKTRILPIVMIVSTLAKLSVAAALVLTGLGTMGVTVGYTIFPIFASFLLGMTIFSMFKKSSHNTDFIAYSKTLLTASVANWIPSLVSTVGLQLGPIVVFGSKGASEAGVFFIALSVATAISGIMGVLLTIAYPALSGMKDGRKRLAWRLTKISLIIGLPLSSSILFFADDVMGLFGENYVQGSSSLQILLLSMMPTVLSTSVSMLAYAYGNYKQVLTIGLSLSVPRTVLYFILVNLNGSDGAAVSYTIGSVLGAIASVVIAKKIKFKFDWNNILAIFGISMGTAFALNYFHIHYLMGILATIVLSCLLFIRLGIIRRGDIEDSLIVLPSKISRPAIRVLNQVGKKLNHSY